MKPLPVTPELLKVAERVVWFKPSEEALADPLAGYNQEQKMHDIYRYAVVTDSVEGLVLVDVDTLADGEPRNNFLKRTVLAGGKTAWPMNSGRPRGI
jgi:hypothetical protein